MMTYSVYHPDPSYSPGIRLNDTYQQRYRCFDFLINEGMIEMLFIIFYVFNDESFSYICFCSLMSRYMNIHFDRHEKELSNRIRLFRSIFSSINSQLYQKFYSDEEISTNYLYRCFLLDCKREFSTVPQILRVMELIWLYSMSCFAKTFQTMNNQSLFIVLLTISILEENHSSSSSSSSLHLRLNQHHSRSLSSMEKTIERAQIYHSNYLCT